MLATQLDKAMVRPLTNFIATDLTGTVSLSFIFHLWNTVGVL